MAWTGTIPPVRMQYWPVLHLFMEGFLVRVLFTTGGSGSESDEDDPESLSNEGGVDDDEIEELMDKEEVLRFHKPRCSSLSSVIALGPQILALLAKTPARLRFRSATRSIISLRFNRGAVVAAATWLV
jgi:hypothetical protein